MQLLTDFSTAAIFRSLPRSPVVIPLRWRLDSLHCVKTAILQLRFYFWRSRQNRMDPNLASRVGGDPRLCFCGLKTPACWIYCVLLFRLLPLSFLPNFYRTVQFSRGLHWQWEKKKKSNEHTPPHTSDLTCHPRIRKLNFQTESRYLLSELYMERQSWSSASGQFNRGVEVSVWGSCWNCRSKMQEASREHPKMPELLNVKCTKNDLEWKIRHLNQITHIFLKNVKGINLSRSFFLWSSLELSC